ncbi:MAG: hypothetical protein Q7T01_03330 [bacterium]|nr:hypothetical protein [bacterium]
MPAMHRASTRLQRARYANRRTTGLHGGQQHRRKIKHFGGGRL